MINFRANPALLFTPGSNPQRFTKANEAGANGIILDLEDGVAEKDKEQARNNVIEYLSHKSEEKIIKLIRINPLTTEAGLKDLLALNQHKKINFTGIVYPKTQSAEELNLISTILKKQNENLPILAFIESGLGLSRIDSIVKNSKNLAALLFGAADYAVDVGSAIDFHALLYVRMRVIQAAALTKIPCYDSPYFDFKNEPGLIDEINQVKKLGFAGKLAIHPKQITIIKSTFKPSDSEFEEANAIVALYEAAKGEVCQYQGKMIDVPIYEKAKQIIATYKNLS